MGGASLSRGPESPKMASSDQKSEGRSCQAESTVLRQPAEEEPCVWGFFCVCVVILLFFLLFLGNILEQSVVYRGKRDEDHR